MTGAERAVVNRATNLETVSDLSEAMRSRLGPSLGPLVISVGVLGASLVAAVVCSLSLAWGVGDLRGRTGRSSASGNGCDRRRRGPLTGPATRSTMNTATEAMRDAASTVTEHTAKVGATLSDASPRALRSVLRANLQHRLCAFLWYRLYWRVRRQVIAVRERHHVRTPRRYHGGARPAWRERLRL
jgi:hypothetical protein